jgi:hypothetical protein
MSILVALIVTGLLFAYWRAALAVIALIVIALVIVGMVTIVRDGAHLSSRALPVLGTAPARLLCGIFLRRRSERLLRITGQ